MIWQLWYLTSQQQSYCFELAEIPPLYFICITFTTSNLMNFLDGVFHEDHWTYWCKIGFPFVTLNSSTTGVTSGTGNIYPSARGFQWSSCCSILFFCVVFCLFSYLFGHCFWYLQSYLIMFVYYYFVTSNLVFMRYDEFQWLVKFAIFVSMSISFHRCCFVYDLELNV
jgi:hypothetical protein